MRQYLFTIAFMATISLSHSVAQDNQAPAAQLLTAYYGVKDALVNSDPNTAANQAAAFQKTLQAIDMKSLPDSSMTVFMSLQGKLAKDAAYIAGTKDLTRQRERFAAFSQNLFALAKALPLSGQPVYYDYCPMKKAYWLSSDAAIKNPYFGSAMLTCGQTTQTLK
jgi:murein L,D-transpeptidase YcbB/YkuD